MNKTSVVLLLLCGAVLGFCIGHAVQGHPPAPAGQIRQTSTRPAELPATPEPAVARERELLLQAIHELDLTSTELNEAKRYIQKLEQSNHRYNWLVEYWKEKGFGTTYRMNFGGDSFKPSDDLAAFFGWEDELVAQLTTAGEATASAIKEWERKTAVCIEDAENKCVYEIEPIPEEYEKQYMQLMEELLPPEDMALLTSSMALQFNPLRTKRNITASIGPPPHSIGSLPDSNPDQEWLMIEVKSVGESGQIQMGGSTHCMSYNAENPHIPERWKHLIDPGRSYQ